MKRAKSVDDYVNTAEHRQAELKKLREILKSTPLEEDVKWGGPCYTHNGKNVVGIGAFKSYVGLWFFQGALLVDKDKVLINAQPGKTKALRQWRMTSSKEIKPAAIKRYVKEAIALVEEGKEVTAARTKKLLIPAELKTVFRADKAAIEAFTNLRPGQQREYADYVAEAKRDDTKQRRIEKILPMILAGKGLNDRYR